MLSKSRKTWEGYYSALIQLPERLKKPVPFVVEVLPTFKRYKIKRVLDLGCGAGRHSVYLAENRFDVIGVDISENALRMANEWVRKEKLTNVAFMRATMTDIPFSDCHFDAVISVSVIHHAVKKDIMEIIDEVYRTLKKNGLFLTNLVSVKNHRYGAGKKVEVGTFRVFEDFEEKRFEELHHFFTRQEVSKLLARFTKVNVETLVGGKGDQPHHYWKIMAIK